MEVSDCDTATDIIQRKHLLRTQAQLTLQLFATVGNFAGFLVCFQYVERIASLRSTVQTEDQSRFGRTSLFDTLVTFVEHRFYATEMGSGQYDVTDLQCSVFNQHGRNISTSFIK